MTMNDGWDSAGVAGVCFALAVVLVLARLVAGWLGVEV